MSAPITTGGGEAAITYLARKRCPEAMTCRPEGAMEGLVFDALVGLPSPPTRKLIMHWTDLSRAQVDKALERLTSAGLVDRAGWVGRDGQTYRVVLPRVVHG